MGVVRMNKLFKVAWHEYRRNVFRRSFILALVSVPLMTAISVGSGFLIGSLEDNDAPVGYVDHAGVFMAAIEQPIRSGDPIEFISYATEEAGREALENESIQALFILAEDYYDSHQVDLIYLDEPGENAVRQFYDFLQINLLSDLPPEIAYRAAGGGRIDVRSLDGRREVPSAGPPFGLLMPLLRPPMRASL